MNEKSRHVGGVVKVAEATADPGLGDLFQVILGRVDVIILETKCVTCHFPDLRPFYIVLL
jgi:hypothetical protein